MAKSMDKKHKEAKKAPKMDAKEKRAKKLDKSKQNKDCGY